jgi:hypothetical protein
MFAILRLRRSKIPENREFFAPEKHILRISLSSTFRGRRVFLNSPTSWTLPRFKRHHRMMLTSGTVSETYATAALAEVAISPL